MEVATDGIYFIIYVTYIIVTTTCFALSSVLFLTKGIKTPLSNNKSYIKGKNLIATGILMEGFVHFLMFITIVLGYKYQNMYEFVIPTIFFVQVIIIYAGLQTFMYSKVNVSYRLGVYMSLPIVAIALIHYAIFFIPDLHALVDGDNAMASYDAYLECATSRVLDALLTAYVVTISSIGIYFLTVSKIRFLDHIRKYHDGEENGKCAWMHVLIWTQIIFYVLCCVTILVTTPEFNVTSLWIQFVLFIIITISTLNIQEIYLHLGPAFGNASTDGEAQQADGADNGVETEPESNDGDPISVIIDRWVNRGDRPYLADGLTVNKVAEQMCLNKRLLSQYLNNVLNQNFNAWINDLKVNEVKRIIEEEPSQNFNTIANRVGFNDAAAMTKIFKSVCGMTPTMYRNSLIKKK